MRVLSRGSRRMKGEYPLYCTLYYTHSYIDSTTEMILLGSPLAP